MFVTLLALIAVGAVAFGILFSIYSRAPGAREGAVGVVIWWAALSAVGVVNIIGWIIALRAPKDLGEAPVTWHRRWQVPLCGIYVIVCALRGFSPKADVQRICLTDSFFASVLVGRSIATLGEVAFVAQWALLLAEWARATRSRGALVAARLAVPIILVAEICSWYAVITTSFLGNAFEQSLWTLTATSVTVGAIAVWRRADPSHRRFLMVCIVMGAAYVLFMTTVDVPMYLQRYLADTAAGRRYFGFSDGMHDLATRWIVTFQWSEWHREIPWMSLYFSVEVWLSISFLFAPHVSPSVSALRDGSAPSASQ